MDIGDGKLPDNAATQISFSPNFYQVLLSMEDLEKKVFQNINNDFRSLDWLCERAIVALKNDDVSRIIHNIQQEIAGSITEYKPIDTAIEDDLAVNYPVEFLNSLELSGIPPQKLTLKIGSRILLLWNQNTTNYATEPFLEKPNVECD